jgi:hypothetical protein
MTRRFLARVGMDSHFLSHFQSSNLQQASWYNVLIQLEKPDLNSGHLTLLESIAYEVQETDRGDNEVVSND